MNEAMQEFVIPYIPEEEREDFNEYDPEHIEWLKAVADARLF